VSLLRRILIVDDDESLRSLLRLTLPTEGFELVEAADGERALEAVRAHVPDLVVLDWRMPGLSGGQVLAEIRERHPRLPVIVLTAENARIPEAVAEALHADAFLTKPFSPLELLGEVERLLAERAPDQPA
jgi:two-component system, OmpR family, response regulator RegX3